VTATPPPSAGASGSLPATGTAPGDAVTEQPAALRIEQRGIDFIPAAARHLRSRDLAFMWGAAVFNVSYVVYGAFVVYIGLSFVQAVAVIFLGCLTFLLVGAYSLQGPKAGTSTFVISRAPFGSNGGRGMSGLNWITVVGYEIITASITVLAALALFRHWGVQSSTALKVIVVIGVTVLQGTLPFLGHAAITRFLRVLLVPFALLFVIMAILVAGKIHLSSYHGHGNWVELSLAFALVAAVGGLGWANMGNDYSRYLPAATPRARIVAAVTIGSGLPSFLLMVLGAATATAISSASDPISGLPGALPGWFVVPYLIAIMVQLIASNSLNLYSSGLTLQAAGLRIKRYKAILLDSSICLILTIGVILSSRFNTAVSDFLLFTILWLTAWAGVFGADAFFRKGTYDGVALLDPAGGLYRGVRGFNVAGVVAVVAGMVASAMWLNTTVYKGPLSTVSGGSDFSVFLGLIISAAAYTAIRAWRPQLADNRAPGLAR
jgi:purine-cytosine permease-like protein